ncbi:uncharacterized protein BX663DRAFT_548306 [Cokeromyces recurvatus]|uniref:uncharacterized protein n=1 Tax=Cokeromyces recurvatus TaxID=90255 RepID=UPI00221FA0DE|nr:uncharacterized protein BX663DRAFT_548306 [Cokeromyces recurvatus]KAI7907243.1 hypothetical protein BX663DRAFT_548306 [Cokeromyces recurvatus]
MTLTPASSATQANASKIHANDPRANSQYAQDTKRGNNSDAAEAQSATDKATQSASQLEVIMVLIQVVKKSILV